MAGQGLGVADVHQALEDLQRIVEAHARGIAALEAEGEDRRRLALHVFARQFMVRVVGQAGVADPGHQRVGLEELRHLEGVVGVALHAQGQGFQALQQQEGVHRRQCCAGVAQRHGAGPGDKGGGAELLGVDHAVVGRLRGVEAGELLRVVGPGEVAAVDDHPPRELPWPPTYLVTECTTMSAPN